MAYEAKNEIGQGKVFATKAEATAFAKSRNWHGMNKYPFKVRKLSIGKRGNPSTLKVAREQVRRLGGSLKHNEYGEYVVKFGKATYHTDSLEDAIGTARKMSESKRSSNPTIPRGWIKARAVKIIRGRGGGVTVKVRQ